MDDCDRDSIVKSLEGPSDETAVSPRTGEGNVKTITASIRRKLSARGGGYPVAKNGWLALESAFHNVVHSSEMGLVLCGGHGGT